MNYFVYSLRQGQISLFCIYMYNSLNIPNMCSWCLSQTSVAYTYLYVPFISVYIFMIDPDFLVLLLCYCSLKSGNIMPPISFLLTKIGITILGLFHMNLRIVFLFFLWTISLAFWWGFYSNCLGEYGHVDNIILIYEH